MLLRTLSNAAYGSLRLALWVKFDEKKKTTILLTYRVIRLKLKIFLNHYVIKVYKILIKFHARFRY